MSLQVIPCEDPGYGMENPVQGLARLIARGVQEVSVHLPSYVFHCVR